MYYINIVVKIQVFEIIFLLNCLHHNLMIQDLHPQFTKYIKQNLANEKLGNDDVRCTKEG